MCRVLVCVGPQTSDMEEVVKNIVGGNCGGRGGTPEFVDLQDIRPGFVSFQFQAVLIFAFGFLVYLTSSQIHSEQFLAVPAKRCENVTFWVVAKNYSSTSLCLTVIPLFCQRTKGNNLTLSEM